MLSSSGPETRQAGFGMEVPLTPLEFFRRARRLYGSRPAVVDGRCASPTSVRRSLRPLVAWLQRAGVSKGRSRRLHRAEHPRPARVVLRRAADRRGAGADQLPPDRRRLRATSSRTAARRSSARTRDYLDAVDSIRGDLPGVEHFVALDGARDGWLDYEAAGPRMPTRRSAPAIDERDLLTINYTSGTTSRPKGRDDHAPQRVDELGRHARARADERRRDRYLWTLPMFHANGWTFTWTVTAVGGTHVCLRKVEPGGRVRADRDAEQVTMLCAAPTVLIGLANAPAEIARARAPRRARDRPPARRRPRRRSSASRGSSAGTVTQVYGLTETAPFITICEPRPEHARSAERARARSRRGRASS